jgi:hypothetical protein
LGTAGTDGCTQKDEEKKSSVLVGTNTATGTEGFLLHIVTGSESILSPNSSGSYGMAPFNTLKEEEIQVHCKLEKS